MSVRNILSTSIRRNFNNLLKPKCRTLSSSSNILDSGLPDVDLPKVSIPELFYSKFEKYENYTALECGLTGRKYSFGDVIKKSKNLSKVLRKKLGLNDGDVVAILLPNIPEFPIAVLGVLNANLIVTTLNPLYTEDEIFRQLADSSTKAIITLVSLYENVTASTKLLKKHLPVFTIKTQQSQSTPQGAIDFTETVENVIDFKDLQPRTAEDVAFLPYSSGTTGLPKGVELTNFNIVANICQTEYTSDVIQETTDTFQDVVPAILPMFHIFGFTVNTFFTLSKGAKVVTLPKFTPEDYVQLLRNYKASILLLVPPIVFFLSAHPMVKKKDLDPVRVIISGAAPLGALDEKRFMEKVGKPVHMLQGYGLTETSPGVTTTTIELKSQVNADGSIGRALSNTLLKVIAIDDPTGTPLGPNTSGELLVKGPQVMKGYLNKPEETAKTFLDGWLRTGDIVHYNENNIFFVTDRLKELIKVKGFQVAPAELEEIVRDFPGVEDAAVIGVPHPSQGEVPRAYIVPKKGVNLDVQGLEEYVKKKVAHYKQLKGGVTIVDSIPKNPSGKIMRRMLKMEYEKNIK